jgi:esterase/lipase superfamily enzyme
MSDELRVRERWFSERLQTDVSVVRWGVFGVPVLVFPSAGGDAEEIERHGLVNACGPLLAEGRVKLYSVDSVAGQAMVTKAGSVEHRMWLLKQFHEFVRWEAVPAIHADLGGASLDVITTGASIGAFNAVAVLCRYPDVFGAAIGMSGSYRIERFYDEAWSQDLYYSAPLQFLPGLEGAHLDRLRQRRVILASGEGEWEEIGSSWQMAAALGGQGHPQPGGQLGPAVGAPVAHLARDAPPVPPRAHLGLCSPPSSSVMISVQRSRHSVQIVAGALRSVWTGLTTRPATWSRRLPQKLHCVLGSSSGPAVSSAIAVVTG